ncbi:MAG: hypothetical protein ACK4L7_00455, partial [Flavobacteriales bacterium]
YQQTELRVGGHTLRAAKHGAIEVLDTEGRIVQRIEDPANKDQHHLAPLLAWQGRLFAGADDGRVLLYRLP